MPEGDTIHGLAHALRPELAGRTLARVDLREKPGAARIQGATVTAVDALGKHLLVHTVSADGGHALTLRVHLGIGGTWHRYRPGEPWRRGSTQATVVLETAEAVHVAFDAPQAEVLRTADVPRHPTLSALGPDLLRPPVDHATILARARDPARADLPAGELLLDQRVACGLGNVFKSELLFIERVHPATPVHALDDATLLRLYALGERLLHKSVELGRRVTTLGPEGARARARNEPLWVYGRAGRPCLRCGARVRQRPQGDLARLTWWCPDCQR